MRAIAPSSDIRPTAASAPAEIASFVVEAATSAPSVLNTQPWWFHGTDHEIGLHADTERQLAVADPDGREMLISCGAGLFTARVALRHLGIVPEVRVLPEPDLPNLVARISWRDTVPPAGYEDDLFAAIGRRRTHQGGFDTEALPTGIVIAAKDEVSKEQATLRLLGDEAQRNALAAVVDAGNYAVRHDSARAREQSRWSVAPGSKRRDGVPPSAYPARPDRVEPRFPARDYAHGHGWGQPPTGEIRPVRSAGVVAILATEGDSREDWISAGQALQRVLLFLTSCGLSSALHTQPLEVPQLREFIARQFCDGRYPQMLLRFGATSQQAVSVRRPVEDVLL
jgi:nitroreductase